MATSTPIPILARPRSYSDNNASIQHMHIKWAEIEDIRHKDECRKDAETVNQIESYKFVVGYVAGLGLKSDHRTSRVTLVKRLEELTKPLESFIDLLNSSARPEDFQTSLLWGYLCLILQSATAATAYFTETVEMLVGLGKSMQGFNIDPNQIPKYVCLGSDFMDLFATIFAAWNKLLQFLKRHTARTPQTSPQWSSLAKEFQNICDQASICADKITKRKQTLITYDQFEDSSSTRLSNSYTNSYTNDVSWALSNPYNEGLLPNPRASQLIQVDFRRRSMLGDLQNDSLSYHNIPFNRNPNFFGRHEVLTTLFERLCSSDRTGFRAHALYGAGGVGKTQIALEFALTIAKIVPLVVWLDCETGTAMARSFRQVAHALKLPDYTEDEMSDKNRFAVLKYLRETSVDWIMIMDNVEDLVLARMGFPIAPRGGVLVTSRHLPVVTDLAYSTTDVGKFNEEDSAKFILRLVGKQDYDEDERQAAKKLSKRLDGLPLALTIMATQIKYRRVSLPKFVAKYEKWSEKLQLDGETVGLGAYKHNLRTCWKTAFDSLPKDSRYMLGAISFLGTDKIPEELFILDETDESQTVPEHLSFCTDWGVEVALKPLLDTSLVNRDPTDGLDIHRLIQDEFRNYMDADERKIPERERKMEEKRLAFAMASTLICSKIPNHHNAPNHGFGLPLRKYWPTFERYITHVLFLARRWQNYKFAPRNDFGDFLALCCTCGWYLMECGRYAENDMLMKTALEICEDKESLIYAHLANDLACSEYERGHVVSSRRYMDQTLALRERLLTPDHLERAKELNYHANLVLQEFRPGAAEKSRDLYLRLIEIYKHMDDEEIDKIIHLPHINIAKPLRILKDYDGAFKHIELARKYSMNQPGIRTHFDGLADYQNGTTYFAQKHYGKARECLHRAHKVFRTENVVHPSTFFAEMKLAELDTLDGNHVKAIETLKRLVQEAQTNEHNKGDKGEVARITRKLADAYRAAGDSMNADINLRQAEQWRKEIQGARFAELPDCDQSYCLLVFHAYW